MTDPEYIAAMARIDEIRHCLPNTSEAMIGLGRIIDNA